MTSETSFPEVHCTKLNFEQVASICDHTFLKRSDAFLSQAQDGESATHLRESAFQSFVDRTLQLPYLPYALCVRTEDCFMTSLYLKSQKAPHIQLVATAGFPEGSWISPLYKTAEARIALEEGASEIDCVLPYTHLLAGDLERVSTDLAVLCAAVHDKGALLKVILEVSELRKDQLVNACQLCEEAGVDFIKTSSGYASGGATVESLKIMRKHFSRGIKISGGVNQDNYKQLLQAYCEDTKGVLTLDPKNIRIGSSQLLFQLSEKS